MTAWETCCHSYNKKRGKPVGFPLTLFACFSHFPVGMHAEDGGSQQDTDGQNTCNGCGVTKTEEMEIIPVYGEPTILMDTVGALSDTSVNFISNGVEYYIASENLTKQEILEVARSISSVPIMK